MFDAARAALLSLCVLAGTFVVSGTAEAACLSDQQRLQAIQSGQLVSFSSVQSALASRGYTQIQSVRVCQGGSGYVYEVVAVSGSRAARFVVDGRSGRILSGG
ncbi:MAG: hypothetical protein KDI98_07550 [Hyphomicrobiaceae bacterium]|nr:hypothetical protein [Hyphomicrobiaceae bacterium]